MTIKHIIAIGGHWVGSSDPIDMRLHQYILDQSGKEKPKVCFIPTAVGDSSGTVCQVDNVFTKLNCDYSTLLLYNYGDKGAKRRYREAFDRLVYGDKEVVRKHILDQDVIIVCGGNTFNMLALWRAWSVDAALKEAYDNGVVMAGGSAGGNCWFEGSTTDSFWMSEEDPFRNLSDGLGFLEGSFCPHYDGEKYRRDFYMGGIEKGDIKPGFAAYDRTGVHFIDEQEPFAVAPIENGKAFQLVLEDGKAVEKELSLKVIS